MLADIHTYVQVGGRLRGLRLFRISLFGGRGLKMSGSLGGILRASSLFSAPTGDLTGFPASCNMDCFCGAPPAVMKSYKLVYFDARGVAETCRLLFAAAKQPYEDVRLSLTFGKPGDFSTVSRPEFDEMKAKLARVWKTF